MLVNPRIPLMVMPIVAATCLVLALPLIRGQSIGTLMDHTAYVNALVSSKDGRLIVSGSDDTTIKLWDAQSQKLLRTLDPPEGRYPGPEKSRGTIYDPVNGQVPPYITSLALSPNGDFLTAGAYDASIRVWDLCQGRQIRRISVPPSGPFGAGNPVFGVAVSPDGRVVASDCFDGVVRLWSMENGEQIGAFHGHKGIVYAVAFSPDGRTLASCGGDYTVRLWDTATATTKRVLKGHTGSVFCVAFDPSGRLLVSGGGDVRRNDAFAELKMWDLQDGKETADLRKHEAAIRAVTFTPDGATLVSSGGNQYTKSGEIYLWNVAKPDMPPKAI